MIMPTPGMLVFSSHNPNTFVWFVLAVEASPHFTSTVFEMANGKLSKLETFGYYYSKNYTILAPR
jgi:hypothetical protein